MEKISCALRAIDIHFHVHCLFRGVSVCSVSCPPDLGGAGGRAHLPLPPQKKFLGGEPPPPPKDGALTSCGGPNGQFLPQNQGKNGQIFPLAPKALAEFLKEPTIVFKLAQICVKNGSKTQKLLQKCPWWRKSVHIASKTLKTTPKYVKTALRAPKARAKNFSQNLAPPLRIFIWRGARPLAGETPTMKHWVLANLPAARVYVVHEH